MTWSKKKKRYHGADPWGRDSYDVPVYAVAGSSSTGNAPDSPAPTNEVDREIQGLRRHLKKNGIATRMSTSQSGNLFMEKIWIIVQVEDYSRAKPIADTWLKENHDITHHIHEAD